MAIPTNNKITGQKWKECALCGFEYPVSQLWKRRGQLVCRDACLDEDLLAEAETMTSEQNK